MIDNFKLRAGNKNEFESHIELNKLISLETSVDLFTGELKEYPKKGKKANLEVKISKCQAVVLGSLHKYHNMVEDNGNQNYNDFNYCQISEQINNLCNFFQFNKDTTLTNLEFGLNIEIENDPQKLIDYSLLMYELKNHNRDMKFAGKGDFKEFQKTDYSLKIYNKSKQYSLKDNILRVEIKIIKTRLLKKLGINCFENVLDKEILYKLFNLLMQEFSNLLIIDDYYFLDIPVKDTEKLNKYTNPNYWNMIRRDKSYKVQYRLKQDFKLLISTYGLDKMHLTLILKLREKFTYLLDYDCLLEVA